MSSKLNLVIEQGTDFYQNIIVEDDNDDPLSANGYTANGSMRKSFQATSSFPIDCTLTTGNLSIEMNAASTSSIPAGRYVYDIKLVKAGVTVRLIEGVATVTPAVTR
jgi:hypothetical protein